MNYTAIDIAKFTINYCSSVKKPISNLKLQKLLYFLWIDFFKMTNRELFADEICAWQLGPVVPEAYYAFCSYGGMQIDLNFDVYIDDEDKKILKDTIDRYSNFSVSALVNITHKPQTPWSEIFMNGQGNRNVIPFELIKRIECFND